MADLRGHDLGCTLPAGWDGRITVRNDGHAEALSTDDGVHAFTARPRPVVHLANFGLPEERGDFGSGAVDIMGPGNLFVCLFEYGPESVGTALFAPQGMPRSLTPSQFSPRALQHVIPGQAGFQTFFTEQNRAFCLFVVLGALASAPTLVPSANQVLTGTTVQPR